MTNQHHVLTATGSSGVVLRASFVWWGDRFGHVISAAMKGKGPVAVMHSIEGDAQDAWPPSPPLQTVSLEKLADYRPVALLVGMAGQSHWSASIEVVRGQAALVFDVACRLGSLPGDLSTRYSVESGEIVSGPGDKQRQYVEIHTDGPPVRIHREFVPEGEVKLRLPEPGELVIRPGVITARPNATVRWKYRVEVAE
jgi:hypothetical protein